MLSKSLTFNQAFVWLLAILIFVQAKLASSEILTDQLKWQLVDKTFANAIDRQNRINSKNAAFQKTNLISIDPRNLDFQQNVVNQYHFLSKCGPRSPRRSAL